jgi:hypothetical protein
MHASKTDQRKYAFAISYTPHTPIDLAACKKQRAHQWMRATPTAAK